MFIKRISPKTYKALESLGFDACISKRDGIFALHIGELDETKIIVTFKVLPSHLTGEPEKYEISSCYLDGLKPLIKGFILEENNDLINLVIVIKNFLENNK